MGTAETVRRTQTNETHEEFARRVESQAERLREAFTAGRFEGRFQVGLELEGVAIDGDDRPTEAPASALGAVCERELGMHNAELHTPATALDPAGVADQVDALADRVDRVKRAFADAGCRFATDGIWAAPPPGGTLPYLTAVHEAEGLTVPTNMAPGARYYALDADITGSGPVELDVPGCRRRFPNILVESLATSMQVHLQTPVDAFARYFDVALRTVGPVLALSVNAPFLPPDLYGDDSDDTGVDPEVVLAGPAELRVPLFESLNVETPGKVRLPRDIDAPGDVLDRLVADRQCAPYLREWAADGPREGFADEYWELLHKQSTCWRWVRPILGPEGPRIEYRPLPAQPCVADVAGLQALVVGLVHGVVVADHPLPELPWAAAEASLYAAASDGLDAELAWVTRDGERTTDPAVIYGEVFDLARRGLRDRGLAGEHIERLLDPVERRWETGTTPAAWKRRRVRDRLDAGTAFSTAVVETQREYRRRAEKQKSFADWLA
jgi:hypothetical protein